MISCSFNKTTETFRLDFANWLKSHPSPVLSAHPTLDEFVKVSSKWQGVLAKDRWVGVHWPEQFGGRGLTIVEEAVVQELLAAANSPQLINLFGLTMVGPVLIKHGTAAQQERFLSKILTAEEIWCQGFSEPEAGSDLAALKTRAVRASEGSTPSWEISGQKVWTSFAQYAHWCFLLARTDETAPKHKGLSYFLMPMSSVGITVRPLQQISGDKEFNELFLDRVVVSDSNMVGAPGEGWKIAISTLMYERVILTFARHLQSTKALHVIRGLIGKKNSNSVTLSRFGQLIAKNMAMRCLALSHLTTYDDQHSPGPEGSLNKLGWTETFQEICQFGLEILGPAGIITEGPFSFQEGFLQHQYLYSRGRTIAAGTSEIQRNIIAERILGLGRE